MISEDIRAVAFDAVGTVLFPVPPASVVYSDAARRHGIELSPSEVTERFRFALNAEDTIDQLAGWQTSEARERARWQRVVTSVLPGTPTECFERLYNHFAEPTAWQVAPDAVRVMNSLGRVGIKIALASNYDARLRSVLAGISELGPVKGRVVISSEVGVRKPGRRFFHAVADVMGEAPGRIAFVGDDPANDYYGAVAAGMFAVLLDPWDRYSNAAQRVRNLSNLL